MVHLKYKIQIEIITVGPEVSIQLASLLVDPSVSVLWAWESVLLLAQHSDI